MDVLNKIRDYIKKSPKMTVYLLIIAVCIAFLLLSGDKTADSDSVAEFPYPQTEYAVELEKELKQIISQIEGIGKVSVMVTVEGTVSYDYQTDISQSDNRKESDTVIISNKEPLIKSIVNPKVSGVLVICDGGDNIKIKEKVIYAVSTVLDIPTSKVYITK